MTWRFEMMWTNANWQIFPLAFAIVDKESKEFWSWFLSCLEVHVVKGHKGLTYISNQAPKIIQIFEELVQLHKPNAYHRLSLEHLESNFLTSFSNKELEGMMWHAAIQYQERKFKNSTQCIRDVKPAAYNYLMDIALDKWTIHCGGHRRWGILTSNLSESFNYFLKKARGLPVTAMIWMTFK